MIKNDASYIYNLTDLNDHLRYLDHARVAEIILRAFESVTAYHLGLLLRYLYIPIPSWTSAIAICA